jgi:uncharacterized RDD family membrane protein YckC
MKFGNTLYYHKGLTFHESEGADAWKVIAQAGHRWYTLLTKNGLAVFIDTAGDIPMIKGYKQQGDRWISFFTHKHFITSGIGAFAVDDADRIALMVEAFPGSLKLFTIEGQEVVGTVKHGRSTPFPKGFMAMMLVPQSIMMFMPLILAFIFSILMSKHRVTYHTTETGRAPFASLTRRAFAQIIDAVILGGPLIVVWFMFMSSIFNFEDAFFTSGTKMAAMFGLMFGGFFWAFLCLIVFSFMEGKWGTTPGKWALGIRVFGTELEYCGFWRALVRNLLKLVDGFFSFMVGIMVIALSEHWQRVGDMAARTIVVDVREQ